jgi:hypothetical protein
MTRSLTNPTKFAIDAISPNEPRRWPVTTTHLAAPFSAQLTPNGELSWKWSFPAELSSEGSFRATVPKPRKVPSTLWCTFAALSLGSDEDFRKFAERWGPLRGDSTEPIATWRHWASLASALVRSSVALEAGDAGTSDDMQIIGALLDVKPLPHDSGEVGQLVTRSLILRALNVWYAESKGHCLLTLVNDQPVIEPSSTTLFGMLAIQLAHRIARAQERAVCFHCKAFFSPARAPAKGTRPFCPKCRKTQKPGMYAARDYRRRQDSANVKRSR